MPISSARPSRRCAVAWSSSTSARPTGPRCHGRHRGDSRRDREARGRAALPPPAAPRRVPRRRLCRPPAARRSSRRPRRKTATGPPRKRRDLSGRSRAARAPARSIARRRAAVFLGVVTRWIARRRARAGVRARTRSRGEARGRLLGARARSGLRAARSPRSSRVPPRHVAPSCRRRRRGRRRRPAPRDALQEPAVEGRCSRSTSRAAMSRSSAAGFRSQPVRPRDAGAPPPARPSSRSSTPQRSRRATPRRRSCSIARGLRRRDVGLLWRPQDYGKSFTADHDARRSRSVNNATVHLFRDVGVDYVICSRAGSSGRCSATSLALGSSPVSARADARYAMFAAGGKRDPEVHRRVLDAQGNVLLENLALRDAPASDAAAAPAAATAAAPGAAPVDVVASNPATRSAHARRPIDRPDARGDHRPARHGRPRANWPADRGQDRNHQRAGRRLVHGPLAGRGDGCLGRAR